MSDIFQQVAKLKIVPLVVIDDPQDAKPTGEALARGGLPCAEIPFRTKAAAEAIKICSKIPGMLVGAGTVLTVDQAKEAVDCGATFIVSPGISPKVVAYCVDKKIPIMPGTITPSDIQIAYEHGLTTVKWFPAESFGGVKTLKAIAAPYYMMKFLPTGGITTEQMGAYLNFPAVVAVGGSWMSSKELIVAKKFAEIERVTREAVNLANKIRP